MDYIEDKKVLESEETGVIQLNCGDLISVLSYNFSFILRSKDEKGRPYTNHGSIKAMA
ncbi:MAG: hypothetical protein ACOCQG_03470 [Candidatus Nanoarchaeia archaeon]